MSRVPWFAAVAALPLACAAADEAQLPAITVTAEADAAEEQYAAVTQKVIITREEIEALGGLTVGEVLRKLPGIDVAEHSADGSAARARGMARDAVQILVDGERPSANSRFALTLVGRQPSGELERIEILHGASAEHGGAAPVTVNLVMRKARPRQSASLRLAAGQRGAEPNGQLAVSRGGGAGNFSWLFPVTVNRHGMPLERRLERTTAPDGEPVLRELEQERGSYYLDELILSPRLTWKRGSDSLTLWPSYYQNDGERRLELERRTPDGAAASGRRDREDSAIHIARLRVEGETRAAGGKLSGRVAVMDGRRQADTVRIARDALGAASAWSESLRRAEDELGAALRLDRPHGAHLLAAGIEHTGHWREERQALSGSLGGITRHSAGATQWTLWLQDEWTPTAALTLTVGLRGEAAALDAGGVAQRHDALLPSVAARWEPVSGWVARASAGGGLKPPRLDELSGLVQRSTGVANTPLEPDRAGNPALRPERSVNLEAGLERHLPGEEGVVGVNLYLRRTEGFIERRTALEDGRWVERPINVGTAHHWGLELDARLRTDRLGLRGGSLRAHLTLPRSAVDDEPAGLRREARDTPEHLFSLGYEQPVPAWSSTAGLQLQHTGPARTHLPGELRADTAARTLLDAHLTRRLTPQLNLRLAIQNLLAADTRRDAAAQSGSDAWSLLDRDAGQRSWMLSLEGKW